MNKPNVIAVANQQCQSTQGNVKHRLY